MRRTIVTERQLRRIVRTLVEKVYIAQPPSVLGRVAFAPQRSWEDGVPPEDNLPVEDKLLEELQDYIWLSGGNLDDEAVEVLRRVMSRDEYGDVIIEPPPGATIYRGLALSEAAMEELCEEAGLDIGEMAASTNHRAAFEFSPKPGIETTSWTTDRNVALDFARNPNHMRHSKKKTYNVVLVARAGDNPDRFLDLRRIYHVAKSARYDHEAEVIGFGRIRVSEVQVVGIEEPRGVPKSVGSTDLPPPPPSHNIF